MNVRILDEAEQDLMDGFRSRRFPFAVYYEVGSDAVNVWAVLDCRQDPAKIATRLTGPRTR